MREPECYRCSKIFAVPSDILECGLCKACDVEVKDFAAKHQTRVKEIAEECDDENPCGDEGCQSCCPHESGICIDCGADRTDHYVGIAEAYYEGDR